MVKISVPSDASNQVSVPARVTVTTSGLVPAGRLSVRTSGHVLGFVKVPRTTHPTAVIRLPRLATGTHVLYGVYRSQSGVTLARTSSHTVTSHAGCAWRPISCGYPGYANTGVKPGTKLRVYEHSVNLRRKGAVFENAIVRGHVDIWNDNVTVRNVRIVNNGADWGIGLMHTRHATVQNVEILPSSSRLEVGVKDVYGDATGTRVLRTEIARTTTGVQTHEGLIEGNFIHAMAYRAGDHLNGTTSNGATTPMTIRHNTILNQHDQTDAISLFQDFGLEANRLIADNLVAGGSYSIYGGQNTGAPTAHNIRLVNNRFSRVFFPNGGVFGPVGAFDEGAPGNVFKGNVWDESGEKVIY